MDLTAASFNFLPGRCRGLPSSSRQVWRITVPIGAVLAIIFYILKAIFILRSMAQEYCLLALAVSATVASLLSNFGFHSCVNQRF